MSNVTEGFEIEKGVWDPSFTRITGISALLLVIIELVVGGYLASTLKVSQIALTSDADVVANGTFAERFVATLSVSGLAVGAALLTIAAWMALLELRARLSLKMSPKAAEEARALGPIDAGKFVELIGALAEKLGKVRGTAAITAAGVAIVIASLAAGASIVVSGSDGGAADDGGSSQDGGTAPGDDTDGN